MCPKGEKKLSCSGKLPTTPPQPCQKLVVHPKLTCGLSNISPVLQLQSDYIEHTIIITDESVTFSLVHEHVCNKALF